MRSDPLLLTQTGTKLPVDLILVNDCISRFSLQPSRGMLLKGEYMIARQSSAYVLNFLIELNELLDELYEKCAQRLTADRWIDTHQFHDAVADDADAIWMAQ